MDDLLLSTASPSNGIVERATQSVLGQVQVLLSALKEKWTCNVPRVCWCSSQPVRSGGGWPDGVRTKRRETSDNHWPCNGEAVLWRKKVGVLGKLTSLWDNGIFLGMGKSCELIIGDGKGVWKTSTVHHPKKIDLVHPPWQTCDDDPNLDGEIPRL